MTDELVTIKTRVPRALANALGDLARASDRSLAAELRRAIDGHVSLAYVYAFPVGSQVLYDGEPYTVAVNAGTTTQRTVTLRDRAGKLERVGPGTVVAAERVRP